MDVFWEVLVHHFEQSLRMSTSQPLRRQHQVGDREDQDIIVNTELRVLFALFGDFLEHFNDYWEQDIEAIAFLEQNCLHLLRNSL